MVNGTKINPAKDSNLLKCFSDNEVKTEKFDDDEKKQIKIKVEEEPLLDESDQIVERRGSYVVAKPRPSIVSIGSYAMSVGGNLHKLHKEDEELTKWYLGLFFIH